MYRQVSNIFSEVVCESKDLIQAMSQISYLLLVQVQSVMY